MLATRQSTQLGRRLLHTTSVKYGFMDWLSMKKEEKKAKPPAEDTSKVIEKAEKGELAVTKVKKIEFIGRKKSPQDERPLSERLKGFYIKHWLNSEPASDVDAFKQIIFQNYTKLTGKITTDLTQVSLENLNLRFQLTKAVQAESGYMIPDYVLTKASDASVLQTYFEKEILTGNHLIRNPDHLSLEELEFTSPNIAVELPVTSRERKSTFKKLLKEARVAQEQKAEKLIETVRA